MTSPLQSAKPHALPAKSSTPPQPPGHWLWGNVTGFRSNRIQFMRDAAKNYGGVVALRLVHRNIWLVTEPAIIETVLSTRAREFRKHFALRVNPGVLSNGLLTSEGDFWLRQRRLSQPAFMRPQIAKYIPTFVEHTTRLLDRWHPGDNRDILQDMMSLTLGIASRTLFGADGDNHAESVRSALEITQQEFVRRLSRLVQIPKWIPTAGNRRLAGAIRVLDAIVYDFIRQRRASGEQRDDLLSRLLHARDDMDQTGMTDKQLRDECLTIFLAGQETTALALSWTWYLLSQHPEAAARVYAEVDEVLGGRTPTAEDLPRLQEVEHVLLESMRLYPPAFIVGREALADMELAGYYCPRGTTILMPQAIVHRDPRYFQNPDTFDPTRWRGDFEKHLPRGAYFPFGGGPRICIGNTFAMVEMTLVLALIAQRFQFTLAPGQTVTTSEQFTLRPSPGVPTVITPR
ncbi:MAG: cytochrome P450 [Planctomycetota bacterium]